MSSFTDESEEQFLRLRHMPSHIALTPLELQYSTWTWQEATREPERILRLSVEMSPKSLHPPPPYISVPTPSVLKGEQEYLVESPTEIGTPFFMTPDLALPGHSKYALDRSKARGQQEGSRMQLLEEISEHQQQSSLYSSSSLDHASGDQAYKSTKPMVLKIPKQLGHPARPETISSTESWPLRTPSIEDWREPGYLMPRPLSISSSPGISHVEYVSQPLNNANHSFEHNRQLLSAFDDPEQSPRYDSISYDPWARPADHVVHAADNTQHSIVQHAAIEFDTSPLNFTTAASAFGYERRLPRQFNPEFMEALRRRAEMLPWETVSTEQGPRRYIPEGNEEYCFNAPDAKEFYSIFLQTEHKPAVRQEYTHTSWHERLLGKPLASATHGKKLPTDQKGRGDEDDTGRKMYKLVKNETGGHCVVEGSAATAIPEEEGNNELASRVIVWVFISGAGIAAGCILCVVLFIVYAFTGLV